MLRQSTVICMIVALIAAVTMQPAPSAQAETAEPLLGYYGDWLGRDQGIPDFTEPGVEPLVPWALQDRFESWVGRPADLRLDFATTPEPGNPDSWAEVLISALEISGPCGHPSQPGGPGARRSVIGMPLTIDGTSLAHVAAGVGPNLEDIDDIWRTIAEDYVAAGMGDAIIRLAFEMDNPGIPWHAAADPTSFVAAWRRAVGVMRSVPGAAFEFSYDSLVSGYYGNPGRVTVYYPGDDVVDYIGIDVYDGINSTYGDPTTRWNSFFGPRLQAAADFAASRGKPMAIGEWGLTAGFRSQARVDGGGGDNAVFMTNMLDFIENNDVAFHIYFDRYGIYSQGPYRLMPYENPAAVAASVANVSWAQIPSPLPDGSPNPVTSQSKQFPAGAAVFLNRLSPVTPTTTTTTPPTTGPAITDQPASARVDDGDTTLFSVSATGAGQLSYQWYVDDVAVPGATATTYTLPALGLTPGCATVTVEVSDNNGTTVSRPAVVTARPVPPTIDSVPEVSIDGQGRFVLTVSPTGSAPQDVRWFVNGVPVPGTPNAALTIANPGDGDSVRAVVTNPGGIASSGAVTLVAPSSGPIPDPRRVTRDLEALWQFTDLTGAGVPDLIGSADLAIGNPAATSWPSAGGLEITGDADISSGPNAALSSELRSASNFSIEMWVTPDVATPSVPGSIVSLADSSADRAMLSQGLYFSDAADDWRASLATTSVSATAFQSTTAPTTSPTHIVFSRRGGQFGVLHVNGTVVGQRQISGALNSWGDLSVLIGEDLGGGREWNGVVHLAAIYSDTLSDAEIALHHSLGLPTPRPGGPTTTTTAPTSTTTTTTTAPTTTTTAATSTTSTTTTTTTPTTTTTIASTTTTTIASTTTTTTAPSTTTTTTTTAPPTTTPTSVLTVVTPSAFDKPGLTLTQAGLDVVVDASEVTNASLYQFRYRLNGGSWSWLSPGSIRTFTIDGLTPGDEVTVLGRALLNQTWRPWASASATVVDLSTTTTTQATTTSQITTTTQATTTSQATTTTQAGTTTTAATTTTTASPTTTIIPSPGSGRPGLTLTFGSSSVRVDATPVAGAPLYQFRYRINGGSWIWSSPSSSRTQTIEGLSVGDEVSLLVRALVSSTWQPWTAATVTLPDTGTATTTTTSAPTTTAGPTTTGPTTTSSTTTTSGTTTTVIDFPAPSSLIPGLSVTLSAGRVDVEVQTVVGASLYQTRYRIDGGGWVWQAPSSSRDLAITGVSPGSAVEIRARALVAGSWQGWIARTVTAIG